MAWLLLAVTWFWFHIGHWHESGRWIAQLLPHREALDADLRLALLINFYAVARASEEFQPIDRYTDELLGLLEVCPDKLLHAAAWHFIAGLFCRILPRPPPRGSGRSRAPAPPVKRRGWVPNSASSATATSCLAHHLWAYADRLIEHGEFARAAPLLMESARLFQARGSRYEMADSLGTLGRLALLQGDMPKAHALLHEAVTLARDFNYQEMLGNLQPLLGLVTLYGGDVPEARRLLEDSLRLCLDLNDKVLPGAGLHLSGRDSAMGRRAG